MKTASIILAPLVCLFLLSGCAMPWETQAPSPPQATAPNASSPSAPAPNATQPAANATPASSNTSWAEEIPASPSDIFANITPRNISDNIGDGQFRIIDMPGEPLRIYAISGGLADSIFVQKGSFHMLVDAGDSVPVQAFLDSKNITRLNVVVATRDYSGAIGGIADILNSYDIDEFWDNNVPGSSQNYSGILSLVAAKGIAVKHPQAGDRLSIQGLKIDILNPQKERLLGNPDTDAIVMKLSDDAFCALLLNPTVQERENAIISTGKDLRCKVVTYFRHGEARPTISLLINTYAQPKDAIISVGTNTLGLPAPATLSWLSIKNITVWQTGAGTVAVFSDGLGSYTIGRYSTNTSNISGAIMR